MFNTNPKKLITYILSIITFLFVFSTNIVSAKELPTNNKALTVISKNLITNSESKETYYEGVEPGDKTSGFSNSYIPSKDSSSGRKKRSILSDSDDRFRVNNTTSFPHSAIASVETIWPYGIVTVGTAWMYGPNIAMTAGHNLYSDKYGGWPTEILIYPGRNDSSKPFGEVKAITIHVPESFTNNRDTNFDWGLIELDKNIGNETGYFGALWKLDSLNDTDITIAGYPAENYTQMWKMDGNILNSHEYKINYNIDTTGGQSGSPVYLTTDNYLSVAIHTNGDYLKRFNKGTRITKGIFDFMESFR